MGGRGRPPLLPPPARDSTPADAPVHFPPPCCPPLYVPPALQEVHHHRPRVERASLGTPFPSFWSQHGGPPKWGFASGHVCLEGTWKLAKGKPVMGRARGAAAREGMVGLPSKPPPSPYKPTLVGCALCWAEPSHTCGSCPKPGETLQTSGGPPQPTRNGRPSPASGAF